MWLYNIAIALYSLVVKLGSLWIPKAKLWRDGRKSIFERMASTIAPNERIIWIHVASLGEFEQGRPIIEKIRKEHPEYKILLTFFSPSGYELRKNFKGVDYIFYLPSDTPKHARKFLDIVKPEIAIFVKYEFWLNMLFTLRKRNIKTYIVSAIFRKSSIFFRPYGFYWRRALKTFDTIFVQNKESKELLKNIGITEVVVAGDTRFDRVAKIAKDTKSNLKIEKFKGESQLMVAGSTWPADEDILHELIKNNKDIKFVVAPHEIEEPRVAALSNLLEGSVRYTQVDEASDFSNTQVLILDTIGELSSIYGYASWSYIGGGFGVGIHNTLEASTFGLPIAFGPNYHKFKEAREMIELGACCSVQSAEELLAWFSPLRNDKKHYEKIHKITKEYTEKNQGATKAITEKIFK